MTKAWCLVASLCLILLISGIALRNGVLLALGLPYMVFVLLPFWRKQPQPDWKVKRSTAPDHLMGGQPCEIEVQLTNAGNDLEEVYLGDLVPPRVKSEGNLEYYGPFRSGQTEELQYTVRGVRGTYEFPGVCISTGDPLGLSRKEELLPCNGTLAVFPAAEKLEKIRMLPRRTRVFTGTIRSRASGAGAEFFGTRAYVTGDPLRHLNWKAGARWDLLITNQFEQERIADIGIILDARGQVELENEGESLFEHSIRAAASLADLLIREGNRVGLLIYGRFIEWTFPGYGKQQRSRIQAALAGAELGEHAVFKELRHIPSRLFPPESQIVMVSPLRREDVNPLRFLRGLGYRILIISPDPVTFENRFFPDGRHQDIAKRIVRMERDAMIAMLRRSGVQMVDWDVTRPLRVVLREATAERRTW
jgi:uncharacterized protein (DUF58 family)